MNVLILGGGGREHAISWKIAQSSICKKLLIAPGNPGTAEVGNNIEIDITDFNAIKKLALYEKIDLIIVGPEDPLVNGIFDFLKKDPQTNNIIIVGPSKKGAQLEGSKEFAKKFMLKHDIPTGFYQSFTKESLEEGCKFLETLSPPFVLKADGLAGGKGVLILDNLKEAKEELSQMLNNKKFGDASSTVIIEEFLDGTELSVFIITDGKSYKILPTAKDYKRIGEGDSGLNTGGMGAVSPAPCVDDFFMKKIESEIINPTILGLQKEKILYQGFLFFGLINVNGSPKVIEYNVRMGDPETEVVMPKIKSDLLDLLKSIGTDTFSEKDLYIDNNFTSTVILASGGYPENYEKNKTIYGLDEVKDSIVFHAGTKKKKNNIITSGGRVIAVTSCGSSLNEALKKSFKNAKKITFENKYYRKDIGSDIVKN